MARTFSLHPATVSATFTLRQALLHINYELQVKTGTFGILKKSRRYDPEVEKAKMRAEAFAFFREHEKELNSG